MTTTLPLDLKVYKKLNMSEINTLVYFDVEATGLKNSGRPKITEVSFVAVNAKNILELLSKIMNYNDRPGDNKTIHTNDATTRRIFEQMFADYKTQELCMCHDSLLHEI